jgi:hypothetical protein
MIPHPFLTLLLDIPYPRVSVLDAVVDETDQTTYTFTGCNVFSGGSSRDQGVWPGCRSRAHKLIIVAVHGLNDTTTFDVTSVAIGGVSGTERIDRGGTTNAVNSAIYSWEASALSDITNTDIVVTWSEAVTACAIGVVIVEGIGVAAFSAGGGGVGTTAFTANQATDAANYANYSLFVTATTLAAANGDLQLIEPVNGCIDQQLVYVVSGSAEISGGMIVGLAKQYLPSTSNAYSMRFDWAGTAISDRASVAVM